MYRTTFPKSPLSHSRSHNSKKMHTLERGIVRPSLTMTELAAAKHSGRPQQTSSTLGWTIRTKLVVALLMAFVSGKLMEYTYVRKLNVTTQLVAAIVEKADTSHSSSASSISSSATQLKPQARRHDVPVVPDETLTSTKLQQNAVVEEATDNNANDALQKELKVTIGTAPRSPNYDTLFTIVSDPRSGAEYVMNVLEQHDSLCASGDYPKSTLLPNTMSWIPDDDIEKGCTLAYVLESLQEMTTNKKLTAAQRCKSKYDPANDKYKNHLQRFCSMIVALDQNYTEEAITNLFVNSYAENNQNIYTGCSCREAATMRGIKVSTEWIGKVRVEHSSIKGTKMIRLTRNNYFERYMSFIIASATGQWSIQNAVDKQYQLSSFRESKYEVNIDEMLFQFQLMAQEDVEMKQWIEQNGHETLWIDRSQLLDNPVHAFEQIFHFLGVKNDNTGNDEISAFVRQLETDNVIDGSLKGISGATLVECISNRDAVIEAMRAHGYGKFVDVHDSLRPIHHIVLSNDANFRVYNTRVGYVTTMMKNETQHVDTNIEPSARFTMAVPILNDMSPDTIVILSNGHATSLNPHIRSSHDFFTALSNVRKMFQDFIPKNAILASISNVCCSMAMQQTKPGTLFAADGQRLSRTCQGSECRTTLPDDEATRAWIQFMHQQSKKNGWDSSDNTIHLDGTFIAGTARNVLKLIKELRVLSWEDDRAVLSDFMYRFPNRVVLDYEQNIFAGRFDGYTSKMNLDCPDDAHSEEAFDTNKFTRTSNALLVSSSPHGQSCTRRDTVETFPMWDNEGIPIIPVLDHIDRVLIDDISMRGIDRHFDKEIFYVVDQTGVWASEVFRDKYRVKPTERFLIQAHAMLLDTESSSNRWTGLRQTVQSSGLPYFGWYGDWKDCNNRNIDDGASIPLFTTCAMTTCKNSFPMPSYMTIIDSQADTTEWYHVFKEFDEKYKWEDKVRQVVWRGGLSENDPNKVFDSQRWRLCNLVASLPDGKEKDMFDIGLTNIPDFLTAQIDIDASLVGGIVKGISPMNDFQKYSAVLDMDGNSWSSRFGTMLCYNSVAIKVEPAYADYWIYDLVPWKHYIPIKNDLSDLLDNIAFVLDPANDSFMQEIVLNANQWCSERFTQQGLISDMLDIWEDYVQLLDRADPDWSSMWATKKEELFSSSSKIPMIQLTSNFLE